MSFTQFKVHALDKIIAHEIHPKTDKQDAYAVYAGSCLKFNEEEKQILANRLETALNNSRKTFQLDYEDKDNNSIYTYLHNSSEENQDFVGHSRKLADNLAASHFRTKIPGGFCLIGHGTSQSKQEFFFVVKAELQEVFNIEENALKLIKDVFLSPAKDFYKIGLFLKQSGSFTPYMYDDQFSLQKRDLTEYFYGKFLGLTTDKNDTLKSKNFFEDTKSFIETNVDNIADRLGLLRALNVLYREQTTGTISPANFSLDYFEGQLKNKFDSIVEKKYPLSFTKDTSLIESRVELQRITIPLTYAISIVGSSASLANLEVIDDPSSNTLNYLEPEINSGLIKKIVVVRQEKS